MSVRSRSRSPIHQDDAADPGNESGFNDTGYADCGHKMLKLKPIPLTWSFETIKTFIRTNCRATEQEHLMVIVHVKDKDNKGVCFVRFKNADLCNIACNELNGIKINNHQTLQAQFDTEKEFRLYQKAKKYDFQNRKTNTYQEGNRSNPKNVQIAAQTPTTPTNTQETYGLSVSYLNSLGIQLPIINKIFIGNLDQRVTEAKLQEIFSYAGQIIFCKIITKNPEIKRTMAKIMYDHPVEAVQAISMFHNQELYNRPLMVRMDNSPQQHKKDIPDGLSHFGPGLGENGLPLRAVRMHLELQPLKQFITNLQSDASRITQEKAKEILAQASGQLNQSFQTNQNSFMNPMVTGMPFTNMAQQTPQNMMNPQLNALNSQGMQNFQFFQNMMQQNPNMDMQTAFMAMQSQLAQNQNVGVSSMPGYGQHVTNQTDSSSGFQNRQNDHRSDYQMDQSADPDCESSEATEMVIFSNLPATVNLNSLSTKMREVGEVKFSEMTGQGRALVRFYNVRDAERCVKLLNNSKVEGQTISVRFF